MPTAESTCDVVDRIEWSFDEFLTSLSWCLAWMWQISMGDDRFAIDNQSVASGLLFGFFVQKLHQLSVLEKFRKTIDEHFLAGNGQPFTTDGQFKFVNTVIATQSLR